MRCRRKFLRYFPDGFRDGTYLDWERDYKATACKRWQRELGDEELRRLIVSHDYVEVARRAVAIESRTNLLFSFEKMALRDAVRAPEDARTFALGLRDFLAGPVDRATFEAWCDAIRQLPRPKTRVLTWPLLTVFGFLGRPSDHCFLKPLVTKRAAAAYDFAFEYRSRPNWDTYASYLAFARQVRTDTRDLRPRDMIDLQSFIWVQGSDEYP